MNEKCSIFDGKENVFLYILFFANGLGQMNGFQSLIIHPLRKIIKEINNLKGLLKWMMMLKTMKTMWSCEVL